MKSKKAFAGLLSVTILSLSAATALAANTEDFRIIRDTGYFDRIIPINIEIEKEIHSNFNTFSGIVKEVRDYNAVEGSKIVLVESDGVEANIIISKDTFIINNIDIEKGSKITGYYHANAPMIMIYPAQYSADVVIIGEIKESVKVDRFNKDLVSGDSFLKLNISNETKLISQDGNIFEGELADRNLVVIYDVATKSIPAQTNPIKVVVLTEKEIPVISEPTDEVIEIDIPMNVSNMEFVVNNEKVAAPSAYQNDNNIVMVPLRSIAEALGFEVKWDAKEQSIMLGNGISLQIGKDNYNYMKTAPITLGAAPEMVNGTTYVPLSFFREVTRMNNAYVFEAQIVIDNGEKME